MENLAIGDLVATTDELLGMIVNIEHTEIGAFYYDIEWYNGSQGSYLSGGITRSSALKWRNQYLQLRMENVYGTNYR